MVELIGDICEPSVLIIPPSTNEIVSGSIAVSGSTLVYLSGSEVWTIDATPL